MTAGGKEGRAPRRLFIVWEGDPAHRGMTLFTTGDYNRATRLARDVATEAKTHCTVADDKGAVYTVDHHGKTTTLRDVRKQP